MEKLFGLTSLDRIQFNKLLETIEYEDGWDLVDMMNYENKK